MVLAGVQINPAEAQVVSLSLEPDFGPVGSKVKVSGTTYLTPSTSKPVRIYWSANETLELAADTLLASITKPKTPGGYDFETTITIPTIPPISDETLYYVIAWQDANGDGMVDAGEYQSETFRVEYFSATISPTIVKEGTYEFTITVKNDISTASIYLVRIRYPVTSGISFVDAIPPAGWFLVNYGTDWLEYQATGGTEISKGASKIFKVTLKIEDEGQPDGTRYWEVYCRNTAGGTSDLYKPYLGMVVDTVKPDVMIEYPSDDGIPYSVGSGNRIWINGTVYDPDPSSGLVGVAINSTKFSLVSFSTKTTGEFSFSFANNTVIGDGKLAVNVTATDKAGNVGSAVRWVIIDNTKPVLKALEVRDDTGKLKEKDGTFYMRNNTTKLYFNVTFYDADGISSKVMYINGTIYEVENKQWIPAGGYLIPSGCNLVIVNNITIIDNAYPTNNIAVFGPYYIRRDVEPPGVPTFTYQAIRGGILIRGLTATDNVGVASFEVKVNDTIITVDAVKLAGTELEWTGEYAAFQRALALNLTDFGGKVANLTIRAEDYAGNKGGWSTPVLISIPEGLWYPIQLCPGWNLISSPLVIAPNTPVTSFLSVMMTGASPSDVVELIWKYDPSTAPYWFAYIPGVKDEIKTIDDGWGYWLKAKAHDVLIVQGWPCPAPPYIETMPPTYSVVKGWNLIGYTSIKPCLNGDYLAGVDGKYLYILGWNAKEQKWKVVFQVVKGWLGCLIPGEGYWIYATEAGYIVPPPF
jgi:hypothetical protein